MAAKYRVVKGFWGKAVKLLLWFTGLYLLRIESFQTGSRRVLLGNPYSVHRMVMR
jgi:hypothetical protein